MYIAICESGNYGNTERGGPNSGGSDGGSDRVLSGNKEIIIRRRIVSEAIKRSAESSEGNFTVNLRSEIMDFRVFDSSIILSLRGGTPRPKGDFPESSSQVSLVGIMLVGRLGVTNRLSRALSPVRPQAKGLGFRAILLNYY